MNSFYLGLSIYCERGKLYLLEGSRSMQPRHINFNTTNMKCQLFIKRDVALLSVTELSGQYL